MQSLLAKKVCNTRLTYLNEHLRTRCTVRPQSSKAPLEQPDAASFTRFYSQCVNEHMVYSSDMTW